MEWGNSSRRRLEGRATAQRALCALLAALRSPRFPAAAAASTVRGIMRARFSTGGPC
jgi:hypothetical protein